MCFSVDRNSPQRLIATENITVYKIATSFMWGLICKPSFHNYLYIKNKLQRKIDLYVNYNDSIDEGYHSYKNSETAKYFVLGNQSIFEFIIPKGSEYYENNTEIVSNQIIYKGKCSTKN
jgi:hypothetical protein